MVELPGGTVTFLLTDVEGSTALWERAPEAMRVALARHDALFEAAVVEHRGVHIRPRGEGDSRFAVFQSAPDAVAAAIIIQRTFAAEAWPTPLPIKVRIGIHSGEAQLRDGDYYGTAVNRCARLRNIGHGGQILLSGATAGVVRDAPLLGTGLRFLGEHRLKDLAQPERVIQVTASGLPEDFPPLASLDARSHNLPYQPTSLLGRERDVAELIAMIQNGARLVTLTGPGGTGKTRLGIQVAAELVDSFEHGAFVVELAPLVDPGQVLPTIARTLGVKETTGSSPLDAVLDHVRGRRMLLLLDNFEHVVAGAAVVSDLIRASPTLSVLVTSRAPLEVGGEQEFPVPPLALPDFARELTPDDIAHAPAVSLFVERAAAVRPDFAVIPDNARAIAEICRQLDGLPLAIELAAARVRLLSPEVMLSRLGYGLGLLAGGRRDVPARHQTLRNAIAWSYALLSEAEQRLFRRLSVFVGGFTLEAAGAICGHDGSEPTADSLAIEVLDGVGSLVANSLVVRDERDSAEPRFGMLETIREYGLEQLASSGEEPAVRTHHLTWCVALAEEGIQAQHGPTWGTWLDRFEAEHDNLRAGLAWGQHDTCDPVLGLRLARALAGFWLLRGYHREGREWLARALARVPAWTALRAAALANAGFLAVRQNDYEVAGPYLDEALSISRELGDTRSIAQTLLRYGVVPHHLGDYEKAAAMLRESLALFRRLDDPWGTAMALQYHADLARDRGDHAQASAEYEEALALMRREGNIHGIAYSLRGLGHLARSRGEYARASRLFGESLALLKELRDRRCIPLCLEGLACMVVGPAWAERTTRLLGAAHVVQEDTGAPAPPSEMADYQRTEADARAALGEERFAEIWAAGNAMSLEEAVSFAMDESKAAELAHASAVRDPTRRVPVEPAVRVARPAEPGSPLDVRDDGPVGVPLSTREREVVALIAGGLSNREIAERLVLSVRTVERHIENIYNRLGISGKAGRAIVTAYAIRHGIAEPA